MFKWLSKLFKRPEQTFTSNDLSKLLKDLEDKKEMKMLLKDFDDRNNMRRGGGSSSSPISR